MSFNRALRSFSNVKDSVSSAGSFNSSLNSSTSSFSKLGSIINPNEDFKENKKCHICSIKFTRLAFRRHHCRTCKESVCSDHSVIRFVKEGKTKKLRVCDKCDKKYIKEEMEEDINNEINEINQKIQDSIELNDSLHSQKFERTSKIHALEMRLAQAEKEMKKKEDELETRLKEEVELNAKAKLRIDDFMKRLEEKQVYEKEISESLAKENSEMIRLKGEKKELEGNKKGLEKQREEMEVKLKDTFQMDLLRQTSCEDCCKKLNGTQKARMSALTPSKK